MKKFSFRLESVLNYRQYLERLAQQEAARAQLEVKVCQDLILNLEMQMVEQADKMNQDLENGMSAAQFNRYYTFNQGVRSRIEDENRRKAVLRHVLKEKIEKLKKKSVDKKVMELYRERQKNLYDLEFKREEQKALDEISSLKTARKILNES